MPTPALMIDSAQEFTPATLANLAGRGLPGVVAVARPLYAGATLGDSNTVPNRIATPLSAGEAAAILGAGLAVLPYCNSLGWGDLADTALVAEKVGSAIALTHSIGLPAGGYMAIDLEDWQVPDAALAAICATIRNSNLGGSGIGYWSAASSATSAWQRLRATNADVARLLLWPARWNGWTDGNPLPSWAPGIDDPAVQAWQFTDRGKDGTLGVDVSLLRLPLLSVGNTTEGLWLADGTVGSPQTPEVAAARASVQQAMAALSTADRALGRA